MQKGVEEKCCMLLFFPISMSESVSSDENILSSDENVCNIWYSSASDLRASSDESIRNGGTNQYADGVLLYGSLNAVRLPGREKTICIIP